MITPNVKHFVFRSETTPAFHYLPGQFITIHFECEGKMLKRSYSIANAPLNDNLIEFAAGYVEEGPGTQFLFNLKPGDKININGPFGRLVLKENIPNRYIFVATSTGVTPYRSMIPQLKTLLQNNPDLKIVILQGVQKKEDVLYLEEFLELSKTYPGVTFHACYSREEDIDLQPHELAGYVQKYFPQLNLNPIEDLIYLCGNPGMIDDSFNYLKEQGFSLQQIIREKYISGK